MDILRHIVYALMLASAGGIIGLVLLQHGKGADMGTGFGAGASGSLFGATGSANFLSRSTAVLAAVFFVSTLALSWFASNTPKAATSGTENLPALTIPVPGTPSPSAPPASQKSDAPPATGAAPAEKPNDIPK